MRTKKFNNAILLLLFMLLSNCTSFADVPYGNKIVIYHSPSISQLSVRQTTGSDSPYYKITDDSEAGARFEYFKGNSMPSEDKLTIAVKIDTNLTAGFLPGSSDVAGAFYHFIYPNGKNGLSGSYAYFPQLRDVVDFDTGPFKQSVLSVKTSLGHFCKPNVVVSTDLLLSDGVTIPQVIFGEFDKIWSVGIAEPESFSDKKTHSKTCLWLTDTNHNPYTLCALAEANQFYLSKGHTAGIDNGHSKPKETDLTNIVIHHPDVNTVELAAPVTFGDYDKYYSSNNSTFWSVKGNDNPDNELLIKVNGNIDHKKFINDPYEHFKAQLNDYLYYTPAYPIKAYGEGGPSTDNVEYAFLDNLVINGHENIGNMLFVNHFISYKDVFEIDNSNINALDSSAQPAIQNGCIWLTTDATENNQYTLCGANSSGREFYLMNGHVAGAPNNHSYPGNNRTHSLDVYVCVNQFVSDRAEQNYTVSLPEGGVSCMYVNDTPFYRGSHEGWHQTVSQLIIPADSPAGIYCTKQKVFSLGAKNSGGCFWRNSTADIKLTDKNDNSHKFHLLTGWSLGFGPAGWNDAWLTDDFMGSGFVLGPDGEISNLLSKIYWKHEAPATLVFDIDN